MADRWDEICDITECQLCDDHGMRGLYRCDHIDYAAIAKRGIAKCKQALKRGELTDRRKAK